MALSQLITGLLNGYTTAQQTKQDRAEKMALLKAQQAKLKAEADEAQMKAQIGMRELGIAIPGMSGDASQMGGQAPPSGGGAPPMDMGGMGQGLGQPAVQGAPGTSNQSLVSMLAHPQQANPEALAQKLATLSYLGFDVTGVARIMANMTKPDIFKEVQPDGTEVAYVIDLMHPNAGKQYIGVAGRPRLEKTTKVPVGADGKPMRGYTVDEWTNPYTGQAPAAPASPTFRDGTPAKPGSKSADLAAGKMANGLLGVLNPQDYETGAYYENGATRADVARQLGVSEEDLPPDIAGTPQGEPGTSGQEAMDVPVQQDTAPAAPGNIKFNQDFTAVPDIKNYEFIGQDGLKYMGFLDEASGLPIPGMKPVLVEAPKPPAQEVAGRLAMALNALDYIDEMQNIIIDPKTGKVDNFAVAAMAMGRFGGAQADYLNGLFKDYADARVRISTGAAINAQEEAYYGAMYKPLPRSVMGTDKWVIKNLERKFQRARTFLVSYVAQVDPTGQLSRRVGDLLKKMGNKPVGMSWADWLGKNQKVFEGVDVSDYANSMGGSQAKQPSPAAAPAVKAKPPRGPDEDIIDYVKRTRGQ